eukprot:Lithocolla_globosa_v1_NODE_8314_length_835_cov_2.844872.p1 type:complete len:263 gc:universal NODE_8314_length_835_cov_2.844872:795-7(-)
MGRDSNSDNSSQYDFSVNSPSTVASVSSYSGSYYARSFGSYAQVAPELEDYRGMREDPQQDWTPPQKLLVLSLATLSSFVVSLAQAAYLPSVNLVMDEFVSSSEEIFLTLTTFLIVVGIMNLFVRSFSDTHGRKKVLLVGLFLFTGFTLACVFSWSITSLICFRIGQAIGTAIPAIVGAGTIADMYSVEERNQAMGLLFIAPLLGPVVGPIVGGAISEYLGWRSVFLLTSLVSFFIFLFCFLFLIATTTSLFIHFPTQTLCR